MLLRRNPPQEAALSGLGAHPTSLPHKALGQGSSASRRPQLHSMALTCAVPGLATCRNSEKRGSQVCRRKEERRVGMKPLLCSKKRLLGGAWAGPLVQELPGKYQDSPGHQTTAREMTISWQHGSLVSLWPGKSGREKDEY